MRYTIPLAFLLAIGVSGKAPAQELLNVWQAVDSSLTDGPLVFTTNDSGFIGTPNALFVTTDGGKNFTSHPLSFEASAIRDMCWPTSQVGYLLGDNGSLAETTNAGNSWNTVGVPSNLTFFYISFPIPGTGYATGEFNPINDGYFVAKTTDNGADWSVVKTTSFSVGPILFKTVMDGMFVIFDIGGVPQVSYTFDSLKDIQASSAIPFGLESAQTSFVRWNDDGSWIVQYEGLWRSSDSGKNWEQVLSDDPSGQTGTISTACFHGERGFAFGDNSIDYQSLDYGASWRQFTNTVANGTSYSTYELSAAVPSATSFMPSDTTVFTLEQGSSLTLLRLAVPPAPPSVVQTPARVEERLEAMQRGLFVQFSSAPEADARNIEIYDVLGRECATLPLAPNSKSAMLSARLFLPGTYFARLGNSIAKFDLQGSN